LVGIISEVHGLLSCSVHQIDVELSESHVGKLYLAFSQPFLNMRKFLGEIRADQMIGVGLI
jgi:hypothetical protein